MARRKGVYSWENEPAEGRRSEFRSTAGSDWQQTRHSTFAEPSRRRSQGQGRPRRRSSRRKRPPPALVAKVAVAVVLTLMALWAMLSQLMSR